MGRWTRYRLRILVGLVLVVGGGGTVCVFALLPPAERGNGLTALSIVLAVIPIALSLADQERRRPPVDARPVDVLATSLADAVDGQWHKEADKRWLVRPAPIPIRWSLSDSAVTGPVAAAVGAPDQPPAFPPLPGHATITEDDLRTGGGRRELHRLFAGLASGRIVVVGPPGSGKSGSAILLVLDVLAHRDSLDDTERTRVPVPVLFPGHRWDPNTTSVQDWLRDRLIETYPMFQRHGGDADAARLVTARDEIALILDGLDEMDETLRPAALQALSDAPFRVVVLTRSQEMIKTTAQAWLVGAAAVHLHDVTGPQAADYLRRARTGPPPTGWPELLTELRDHPDGVLAHALSTPLTLTLLRDTYQAGDDVSDLLNTTHQHSTDTLEHHLIARVLPAAYTPRAGRPAPPYSERQAHQTLTYLARQMGTERNLAWWHIPSWTPVTPRILATGLVFGLVSGIGVGIVDGFAVDLTYGLVVGLTYGLGAGLGAGLAYGLGAGLVTRLGLGIVVGLVSGFGIVVKFMSGPMPGLRLGPGLGLVIGLVLGLVVGRIYRLGSGEPRRVTIVNWRVAISRRVPRKGLVVGLGARLAVGLGCGLVYGLVSESESGLVLGLGVGLMFGLGYWLVHVLINMFFEDGASESSPLGPYEIWRNDRMAGIGAGLMSGLGAGLGVGLGVGFVLMRGVGLGVGFGVGVGLGIGIGIALIYPAIWQTTLAWRRLRRRGHVPAVSLMPFLEDARERGVLRTVGGVYQFRHATLQDQLAGRGLAGVAESTARSVSVPPGRSGDR